MGQCDENPHFLTVESLTEAGDELAFTPVVPRRTAGRELLVLRLHVRDHKLRELPVGDRTFEASYGAFVVSQQRAESVEAARRLALERPYGSEPRTTVIGGHEALAHELGPEVPPDDIDGRSPAVIVWADGDLFHLVAGELEVAELIDVAESIYD